MSVDVGEPCQIDTGNHTRYQYAESLNVRFSVM